MLWWRVCHNKYPGTYRAFNRIIGTQRPTVADEALCVSCSTCALFGAGRAWLLPRPRHVHAPPSSSPYPRTSTLCSPNKPRWFHPRVLSMHAHQGRLCRHLVPFPLTMAVQLRLQARPSGPAAMRRSVRASAAVAFDKYQGLGNDFILVRRASVDGNPGRGSRERGKAPAIEPHGGRPRARGWRRVHAGFGQERSVAWWEQLGEGVVIDACQWSGGVGHRRVRHCVLVTCARQSWCTRPRRRRRIRVLVHCTRVFALPSASSLL